MFRSWAQTDLNGITHPQLRDMGILSRDTSGTLRLLHSSSLPIDQTDIRPSVLVRTRSRWKLERALKHAARATLRGLKRRDEVTKIAPAFIHTSGTGLRIDEAYGQYGTDPVYDGSGKWTKAPSQPHRNVDMEIDT
ncbi:hypothetical protein DFP72DRAFT_1082739 [Ephemerocybe angulata]|uniref:Uncharacterized protein n=1 Tax=Ephemerocybe angulata TaxID=980116 RepID=A0A8H6LUW4_9AGAR|nr:hypothetical protein DFP72DRAFT_1082739 [Tulosesus angulatus]